MRIRFYISIFLALFCNSNSFAYNCENKRLDQLPNSPLNYMPIRDQGFLGTCYAYTGIQLIDYLNISKLSTEDEKKKYKPSSPNYLALKTYEKLGVNITGGVISSVLSKAKEIGVCDEENVNKAIFEAYFPKKDNVLPRDDFVFSEEHYFIRDVEFVFNHKDNPSDIEYFYKSTRHTIQFPRNGFCKINSEILDSRVNNYNQLAAAIEKYSKKEYTKFLINVIDPYCKDNFKKTEFIETIKNEAPLNSTVLLDEIQSVLKDNRPIAISYCHQIILSNNEIYDNLLSNDENNHRIAKPEMADKCKPHGSIIIGMRKTKKNKCEFLIRNSLGSSCYAYKNPKNCENGQIWVDADLLNKNLLNVTSIK